ncbi:MAG: hypothetical protein QF415_07015 [Candidatus Undinarchaeales archaeon]|jgi:hypothetical protein|nr:hypothetical protein [Candidatus Undinarchaeales archaeon]MDP7494050.1 hypothetical protein [Candidatus Undinarchaeales archaeon]
MYQKLQIVALAIAFLLLLIFPFGGAYYRGGSSYRTRSSYSSDTGRYTPVYSKSTTHEYEYVRLGNSLIDSIMILMGLGALGYALKASYDGLSGDAEENAGRANNGATFAVVLSVVGAIMFSISYGDATTSWFDAGFYGTFFGGLTAIFAGKQVLTGA